MSLLPATSSSFIILSAAAPSENVHQPAAMTVRTFQELFSTLPPQSPSTSTAGYSFSAGRSNCSIIQDASVPHGHGRAMRIYWTPLHQGGTAPINMNRTFGAKNQIYIVVDVKCPIWTNHGNSGCKFFFFSQITGTNHFINWIAQQSTPQTWKANGIFASVTVQGTTIAYLSPLFFNAARKNRWLPLEFHGVGATVAGTADGQAYDWVDNVIGVSAINVLYSDVGDSLNVFDRVFFSPTYGGGGNRPPGVVGVGGAGTFVRTSLTGTAAGLVFTLSSGAFSTSGAGEAGAWFSFVNAAGVLTGPYKCSSNTASAITMASGAVMTGAVACYRGMEPFDDTVIGKTVYIRSSTLNQWDGVSTTPPIPDGQYPLIAQAVITGVTTTNQPRDTVTFSGNATGGSWMFGIFSDGDGNQQSEPLHIDVSRVEAWHV